MEQHYFDTWHRRPWSGMRTYVQLDLGKRPATPGTDVPITLDDARTLVARERGFDDWTALAASVARVRAGAPLVLTPRERRAERLRLALEHDRVLGTPADYSVFTRAGSPSLWRWLVVAWTLAAVGEELVFRGYALNRIVDLVGDTRAGWSVGVVGSSVLFGLGHYYQGWAGVAAATTLGLILALIYLRTGRTLWTGILCHGLLDTISLLAVRLTHHPPP